MLHRMGEAVLLDGDLAYAVETFELALTMIRTPAIHRGGTSCTASA
jgi:hypothetical protein